MSTNPEHGSGEQFLAAATAGLKNDRELQLDVAAELRSHLEERRREAEANGLAADAAEAEAVRAMGPAADLAGDLERANRRRMRLRALVRLAAQWLLAPLAIVLAVLSTDIGGLTALRLIGGMTGMRWGCWTDASGDLDGFLSRKLSPEQRLVLHGDTTLPTLLAQQKAIWNKWPDNKVYLHNYVTYLLSKASDLGKTPEEQQSALAAEIAKLRARDPGNARFDYILAESLLRQAVEDKPREVKDADGKVVKTEYDMVVKDRAKLDAAMDHFKAGLAKPEYRRYAREMAQERLAIMGEPTSLVQQVGRIGMLAGILLPDVAGQRNLARKAITYGELLASEGRRDEADVFLNAPLRFAAQINRDAFVLIDVLVVGAITEIAASTTPAVYERLGDPAAAERARAAAAPLAAPIRQWKEKGKRLAAQDQAQELGLYGGILAAMLLPALNEQPPSAAELAPSRNLEYVVAEGLALIGLSAILFAVMVMAGLVAVYFRRIRRGGTGTLLLLPEPREVLRLLGLGVLLPLLLYYALTRWTPCGGRDLGLRWGWPQLLAQFLALLLAMLGTLSLLLRRLVSRRCQELLLPVPPPAHGFWRCLRWSLPAVTGLFAVAWNPAMTAVAVASGWKRSGILEQRFSETNESAFFVLAALLALWILAELIRAIVRDARFGRRHAAYYGSLARTVIPVAALALILVNLCSRPYLRMEERRLLKRDTIMGPDPENAGFTLIESRLTQRLKAEIQKAADETPGSGVAP